MIFELTIVYLVLVLAPTIIPAIIAALILEMIVAFILQRLVPLPYRKRRVVPSCAIFCRRRGRSFCASSCKKGRPPCTRAPVHESPAQADADKIGSTIQKNEATVLYRGRSVRVSQDEEKFNLSLDLPGARKDSVKVDLLDNGILRVEADRTSQNRTSMTKHFVLDETVIDDTNIQAILINGVLDITVPKKEREVSEPLDITVTPNRFGEEESAKTNIVCTVDVPGVEAKDIKVTFRNGKLSVWAERRRGEDAVSRTRRCLHVNAKRIDTSRLQALLADGVLTVVAPESHVPPSLHIVVGTDQPDSEETTIAAETVCDKEVIVDEAASNQTESQGEHSDSTPTLHEDNGEWEQVDE